MSTPKSETRAERAQRLRQFINEKKSEKQQPLIIGPFTPYSSLISSPQFRGDALLHAATTTGPLILAFLLDVPKASWNPTLSRVANSFLLSHVLFIKSGDLLLSLIGKIRSPAPENVRLNAVHLILKWLRKSFLVDIIHSPLLPLDVLAICESGVLCTDVILEYKLETALIEKRTELTVHSERQFILRLRTLLHFEELQEYKPVSASTATSSSSPSTNRLSSSSFTNIFSDPSALASLSAPSLAYFLSAYFFLLANDVHPAALFVYTRASSLPLETDASFGEEELRVAEDNPRHLALPLQRALDHFFLVARWVSHSILRQTSPTARAHLIGKFIFVASSLETQQNLFAVGVVMAGLNHVSVNRLKDSWRRVPKHLTDSLALLRENFPYSSNATAPLCRASLLEHLLQANRGKYLVPLPFLLRSLDDIRCQYHALLASASPSSSPPPPSASPNFELYQLFYDPILNFHLSAHQPGTAAKFCKINELHSHSVNFLLKSVASVHRVTYDELLTMSIELESPLGLGDKLTTRRNPGIAGSNSVSSSTGSNSLNSHSPNSPTLTASANAPAPSGQLLDAKKQLLLRQVSVVKPASPQGPSRVLNRIFRVRICDDPVMRKMGISNTLKSVQITESTNQIELKHLLVKQITRGMTEEQSKLLVSHTHDFDIYMVIDDDLECKLDQKLVPWDLLDERPVPEFVFRSTAAPSRKLYAPVGHPIEVWWMALTDPNVVSEYLQAGFAVDTKNPEMENRTGLQIAAAKGCLEVVQLLIKYGANVDAAPTDTSPTALHLAIQSHHADIVSFLLRHRADANRRAERGRTPLMYAALEGNKVITSLLLYHGVDVNATDSNGSTALHMATAKDHPEIVDLFIEYAAAASSTSAAPSPPTSPLAEAPSVPPTTKRVDFDILDTAGFSPLHLAARHNHLAILKRLLTVSATASWLFLRDESPQSILHAAKPASSCHRLLVALSGNGLNLADCSLDNAELTWVLNTLLSAPHSLYKQCVAFGNSKSRNRARTKRPSSARAVSPREMWLASIKQIDLRSNRLTDLPKAILQFADVIKMDLRDNNFDTIPSVLPRLTLLKFLFVQNNPLRKLPSEVVQLPTEELLSYVRSFDADSLPWTQLKLMVVGAEAVGKTSLIRRLVPHYKPKLDANNTTLSTEGIAIVNWKPEPDEMPEKEPAANYLIQVRDAETDFLLGDTATGAMGLGFEIEFLPNQVPSHPQFRVWDLGGQVIFYPTHQFFMTQRCIYVLAFNVCKFRKAEIVRVEYWLRQIKSASGGMFKPPIILVGTHWDALSDEDRIPTLKRVDRWAAFARQSYNVKEVLYISSVTDAGIQRLRNVIHSTGQALIRNIPGTYLKYAVSLAAIHEQGAKHINRQQAIEMGVNAGLAEGEVDTALKFLHNTGALLHWSEDDSHHILHDFVVLDPQWLANAMASLVTFRAEQWVRNGVTSVSHLCRVWKGNGFTEDECAKLMGLLANFEIVHSLRAQPSILPAQEFRSVSFFTFESTFLNPEIYSSSPGGGALSPRRPISAGPANPEQLLLIPCLLPDSLPSYRALSRLFKLTDARPSVSRVYQFAHLPVGLPARLVVRLLHKPNIHLRAVWKSGAVMESQYMVGTQPHISYAMVEFDDSSFTLVIQQLSKRVTDTSENTELFSRLVYSAESLIASYYPGLERTVVRKAPCRHCLSANFPSGDFLSITDILHPSNTQFLISDCFIAASNPARPFMYCSGIPVRVEYLAPDLAICGVPVLTNLAKGRLLGRGGFGEVYLATLTTSSGETIEVALKTLKISEGNSAEFVSELFEKFQREVWIMSLLNHPHLVHLYGMTLTPAHAMVMEFLPCGDLYHLLDLHDRATLTQPFKAPSGTLLDVGHKIKLRRQAHLPSSFCTPAHQGVVEAVTLVDGQWFPIPTDHFTVTSPAKSHSEIPWLLRIKIARDIALGMAYLQSLAPPIVHRDLRSPNVFITSLDPRAIINAKVADFGLAQLVEHSVGGGLGTFQWLAPEIIRIGGLPIYDERSDIYSFAMVMYEICSRSVPFMEDYWEKFTERSGKFDEISCITEIVTKHLRPILPPDTPPAFAALITQAWDANPDRRPSFEVITAQLTELLTQMDPTLPALDPALLLQARLQLQALHDKVIASSLADLDTSLQTSRYELSLSHMFQYPSSVPVHLAVSHTAGYDRTWCLHADGKVSVYHGQRAELLFTSTAEVHEEPPHLLLPFDDLDTVVTFDPSGQIIFWNALIGDPFASANFNLPTSAVLDLTPTLVQPNKPSTPLNANNNHSTSHQPCHSPPNSWERPFFSDDTPRAHNMRRVASSSSTDALRPLASSSTTSFDWSHRVEPRSRNRILDIQIGAFRKATPLTDVAAVPLREHRIWIADFNGTICDYRVSLGTHPSQLAESSVDPVTMTLMQKVETSAPVHSMCLVWDQKLKQIHEANASSPATTVPFSVWLGGAGALTCIDVASYQIVRQIPAHGENCISSIVFLASNAMVWTVAGDSEICVWDAMTGTLHSSLSSGNTMMSLLQPLLRDTKVVASSPFGSIIIWDATLLSPLQQIPANVHSTCITSLIACPASDTIWTCAADARLCCWTMTLAEQPVQMQQADELVQLNAKDLFPESSSESTHSSDFLSIPT